MRGLIPLMIPFQNNNRQNISSATQAIAILEFCLKLVTEDKTVEAIGITYSANHLTQTRGIREYYIRGQKFLIDGANQAAVIKEVQKLLGAEKYNQLFSRFYILPISTCLLPGGIGAVNDKIITYCLCNIACYLGAGVKVLGWQNQETKNDFAIGGGSSQLLTLAQQNLIQNGLHYFQVATFKEEDKSEMNPSLAKIFPDLRKAYELGGKTKNPQAFAQMVDPAKLVSSSEMEALKKQIHEKESNSHKNTLFSPIVDGFKESDAKSIPRLGTPPPSPKNPFSGSQSPLAGLNLFTQEGAEGEKPKSVNSSTISEMTLT